MTRNTIFHALGLHMHQPPGNLRLLMDANPWEAEQIVRCYERPLRYAARYRDVARLHIGFSGVLLEQLLDPGIVDRYRHIVDIPEMLDRYGKADNIELIGMGYYHPIFPLIPQADWPDQLERGREVVERAFGRPPHGFWPSEMAFSMEMIPALVDAGYDYAVVDGVHVLPEDGIVDVFRPYLACHDGVCIAVVPRDRDVSNAQQSGFDATWFQHEVRWRVGGSARPHEPRLVTTWSDGENGGWFRQTHEGSGFFGHYFAPYMEHLQGGEYPIAPVSICDYLRHHPPVAQAQVQTGAWNVGSTSGLDFSQWAGSDAQRAAVEEVHRLSSRYWNLRGRLPADSHAQESLGRARRLILEAETSCFLFWGDAWIPHLYEHTRPAARELDTAESAMAAAHRAAAPVPEIGAALSFPVAEAKLADIPDETPPETPPGIPPGIPPETPPETLPDTPEVMPDIPEALRQDPQPASAPRSVAGSASSARAAVVRPEPTPSPAPPTVPETIVRPVARPLAGAAAEAAAVSETVAGKTVARRITTAAGGEPSGGPRPEGRSGRGPTR